MYTVAPYYLTKVITEFPSQIFIPLLFEIIVYFGIGLTITAS